MKIRNFFDWAVCGYGARNSSCCFTRGFRIGTDTRRGVLFLRLLDMQRAVIGCPRTFRLWLADTLSRWAMRLRGETEIVFGFYDSARGNLAARQVERIRGRLISWLPAKYLCAEEMGEISEELDHLGQLAEATWRRNNVRPE